MRNNLRNTVMQNGDVFRAQVAALVSHLADSMPFRSRDCDLIAIQAGHFMLLRAGETCVPSVATTGNNQQPVSRPLNNFALGTWRIGVALTSRLNLDGHQARLLTMVNDWYYLKPRKTPNAGLLRTAFYETQHELFPSYAAVLKEHGLSSDAILAIGNWNPFISEYWLRRRIERRLKRIVKERGADAGFSVEDAGDGRKYLVYDEFGRACRLLVCGQADCAGEVMELVCVLHEMGYRQLVNLVPSECKIPVNEGTRRAIAAFKLADFSALNIAIPCFAAALDEPDPLQRVSVSRVYGEKTDGDLVEAVVEPVSTFNG